MGYTNNGEDFIKPDEWNGVLRKDDLAGNSKAVPELYWIRNRVNSPSNKNLLVSDQVFITIENKLYALLKNLDNVQMNLIMDGFWNNFPFIRSDRFISKAVIIIKRKLCILIKKKPNTNIDNFLNENKIKYDEHDIYNVLKSMRL